MRVFVTGAAGFVGRHLVPVLEDAGHTVSSADQEVDVTDQTAVGRAFASSRPEAVVHLAAQSSVAASFEDPLACFRVNFLGTRALLCAAREWSPGTRILLIGSGDQYPLSAPGARGWRESDPLAPRSPYARSKAAAELLGSLAADAGMDVVRVRAFNHTGPGQTDRFVAPSFARQVAEIEAGRRAPHLRVGNLASMRDFLDVRDVVTAYAKLLEPEVAAGIYNVASGSAVEIRAVLEQLLELAGVDARIEVDPERVRPTDQLLGDPARICAATGFAPTIALRQTLSDLLDDWRSRTADVR